MRIYSALCADARTNTHSLTAPPCTALSPPHRQRALGDYSAFWRALDAEVAATPPPAEYAGWTAAIVCNDCSAASTVPFSLVALRCAGCGSYNTSREGLGPARGGAGAGAGAGAGGAGGGAGAAAAAAAIDGAQAAALQVLGAPFFGGGEDEEGDAEAGEGGEWEDASSGDEG
jgi:hypothetical protein